MKKVLIMIFLAMLFAGNVMAEPIILKYAQFEPSNEVFAMKKIWLPWVEKMNTLGEGMFKIEVYVGGTLNHVPPKQLKILKDGVADIAFILPSYTPGIFADDAVLEIPFLADKAIDASLAVHNLLLKGMFLFRRTANRSKVPGTSSWK